MAVTNAHVVGRATEVQARLWTGDVVHASIERRDSRRDLAILRVSEIDNAGAALRESNSIRPGELAIAVGSPLGFLGAVSMGVVRAVGPVRGIGARRWIQADIRLAPGNSGGPLVDVHGRVLGINTMISNGLGLAVPSDTVQQFLTAKAPFRLGVTVRPVTLPTGTRGVLILEVEKDSAADRASLIPGDLLVAINEAPVRSVDDVADALEHADRILSMRFQRGGQNGVRQTTAAAA
jgi:serine protease Do